MAGPKKKRKMLLGVTGCKYWNYGNDRYGEDMKVCVTITLDLA